MSALSGWPASAAAMVRAQLLMNALGSGWAQAAWAIVAMMMLSMSTISLALSMARMNLVEAVMARISWSVQGVSPVKGLCMSWGGGP